MQGPPRTGRGEQPLRGFDHGSGVHEDVGATETVGTLLLVAVLLVLAGGLAALVLEGEPGSGDQIRASFAATVLPGEGGIWGTGDEHVRIEHKGGQAVPLDGLLFIVDVRGERLRFSEQDHPLDHGAQDAFGASTVSFEIGDRWRTPDVSIAEEAQVEVMIVSQGDGSRVLWGDSVQAGVNPLDACDPDLVGPYVLSWDQDPADVTTATSSPVSVTVTVGDTCQVDTEQAPSLEHRVNDGSTPSWTNEGPMDHLGDTQWSGEIPDPGWSQHEGENLEYRVVGMQDASGNSATSPIRFDGIEVFAIDPLDWYVQTPLTMVEGTVEDEVNVRDADGAVATLREAEQTETGGPVTDWFPANVVSQNPVQQQQASWEAPENAFQDDAAFASVGLTGGSGTQSAIQYGLEDPPVVDDAIEEVVLNADVRSQQPQGGGTNLPSWRLQACLPGACSEASTAFPGETSKRTISYDVTERRPGAGSWSWQDLQSLEVRVIAEKTGGGGRTVELHYANVDVTLIESFSSFHLETGVWGFDEIQEGQDPVLEVRYRVDGGEAYDVEVWDGASWNARGDPLDQASMTLWSTSLTETEMQEGPQVRILDRGQDDGTQGSLGLDFVRIRTT